MWCNNSGAFYLCILGRMTLMACLPCHVRMLEKPDSIELSGLPAGLPPAQLKNSLHMQHQNPEWEDTATGSACMGTKQSDSEGGASQEQQGQHCSQHNISSEAAAAGLGMAIPKQAYEVAQDNSDELAGAPQADDGMGMDGSAAEAERLVATSSAVRDPQHARQLEARAQPDIDNTLGDCTASGWHGVEAGPIAAPTLPHACTVLAAPRDKGSLPGAPGICMSIAAQAMPPEADADLAEPSADGACHSKQMSMAAHSSAGAAEGDSGTLAQGVGVAQATRNAQPRGSALYSSAADNKDGISVSVSQCNMAQIPEESISELADLAPVGWQREFEASLYGPASCSAGQAGSREPAAGQLTRPVEGPDQTQQVSSTVHPRSHPACKAPAVGRPQLAKAIRRRGGRGQGAVSAAGPADDTELEAVPAAGAAQAPAAAPQRRRGAPRKLAARPAEGPAVEHEPEAGAAAVQAAEASQASKLGQQRQMRPSREQETRQFKGQQPLRSLNTWSLCFSEHSRRPPQP